MKNFLKLYWKALDSILPFIMCSLFLLSFVSSILEIVFLCFKKNFIFEKNLIIFSIIIIISDIYMYFKRKQIEYIIGMVSIFIIFSIPLLIIFYEYPFEFYICVGVFLISISIFIKLEYFK